MSFEFVDEAIMGVFWSIGGSIVCITVCVVMFCRADREAIRLYNLKYSEKHDDEERTLILAKMKKRLQWLYGLFTLVFASILIKTLTVLFLG